MTDTSPTQPVTPRQPNNAGRNILLAGGALVVALFALAISGVALWTLFGDKASLSEQVGALSSKMEDTIKENMEASRQVGELKAKKANLESDLQAANSALATLQAEDVEDKATIDELNKRVSAIKAQSTELAGRLSEAESRAKSKEAEVTTLKKDLSKAQQEIVEQRREILKLANTVASEQRRRRSAEYTSLVKDAKYDVCVGIDSDGKRQKCEAAVTASFATNNAREKFERCDGEADVMWSANKADPGADLPQAAFKFKVSWKDGNWDRDPFVVMCDLTLPEAQ